MPLYDYQCAACGRRFEVVHGVHEPGPTTCPLCGKGPVRKSISAPAVHYKGSGWAKKERRAPVTSGAAKAERDGTSADASAKDAPATDATAKGGTSKDRSGKDEAGRGGDGKGSGSTPPAKKSESSSTQTTD